MLPRRHTRGTLLLTSLSPNAVCCGRYVVRLCARVDNFVSFLLAYDAERHDSIRGRPYRQLTLGPGVAEQLDAFRTQLHGLLWGELRTMLLRWYHRIVREGEEADDGDADADDRARRMCSLHAHLLLMLRSARVDELSPPLVQTLMCGMVFLSTRHQWNHEQLADEFSKSARKVHARCAGLAWAARRERVA
jgi:hypothetical protein